MLYLRKFKRETMTSRTTADILLFDLGGVLVDYDGISPLVELTNGQLTEQDARSFWTKSHWMQRYETGKCSTEAFLSGVSKELNIDFPADELLHEFESWEMGPFTGALEMLDQLSTDHTLGCLSNNNPVHWDYLDSNFGLGKKFEHCFLSHLIGFAKPDKEIYLHVIDKLNIAPHRIHFFDDKPENVKGAKAVGLSAYHVKGIEETKKKLDDIIRNDVV